MYTLGHCFFFGGGGVIDLSRLFSVWGNVKSTCLILEGWNPGENEIRGQAICLAEIWGRPYICGRKAAGIDTCAQPRRLWILSCVLRPLEDATGGGVAFLLSFCLRFHYRRMVPVLSSLFLLFFLFSLMTWVFFGWEKIKPRVLYFETLTLKIFLLPLPFQGLQEWKSNN